MNSLKAMYGCGLNFFIKLAYNSFFLYKFAKHYALLLCMYIIISRNWYSFLLPLEGHDRILC